MGKSKRVLWEIMIVLDEAGEEDMCSLLNQVMSLPGREAFGLPERHFAGPHHGSGADLKEYLDALQRLTQMGEVLIREYRDAGTGLVTASMVDSNVSSKLFGFDPLEMIWKWKGGESRLMVQVTNVSSSRRLLWEIMVLLDEVGKEDICSLLNQVQPFRGPGVGLGEFLDAIQQLVQMGEVLIRKYKIGKTGMVPGTPVGASVSRTAFGLDAQQKIWTWKGGETRFMVEVTNGV